MESLESKAQEFISEWGDTIGGVPFPICYVCKAPVIEMQFKADPVSAEYLFTIKCHGDTQIMHLPFWYAHLIQKQMEIKKSLTSQPVEWRLPQAFETNFGDRFDGVLHYDFGKVLEQKIRMKEAAATPQSELDAKAAFEEEFEFERAKGRVITLDGTTKTSE